MIIDCLFSAAEARRMAGLGTTKFYEEIASGRLSIVKNGRRTFVRASELQRYIDALSAGNDPKTP